MWYYPFIQSYFKAHLTLKISLIFPGSVLEHPLFSHGVCRWTGCEAAFDSLKAFTLHLARDHVLDERSTAQTRVQVSRNYNDTL